MTVAGGGAGGAEDGGNGGGGGSGGGGRRRPYAAAAAQKAELEDEAVVAQVPHLSSLHAYYYYSLWMDQDQDGQCQHAESEY